MRHTKQGLETGKKVIDLIAKFPNTKWYHMHAVNGLSYRQYHRWAEILVKHGDAIAIDHGHNQHDGWRGYKLKFSPELVKYTLETGIPF